VPASPVAPTPGAAPEEALGSCVTIADVRRAAARIAGRVRTTPTLDATPLDAELGASLFIKCEGLQWGGAFKLRGATNALLGLSRAERERGVLAYSSGNHAQAVARAGASLSVPTVIVMPRDAPAVKLDATRAAVASAREPRSRVVLYDPQAQVRERVAADIARREGLAIIPPYDHPEVIAGQGTAALELFAHAGALDVLLVCCGGGGLLSGCAVVAGALAPACVVVGVEPALADDATRSFRAGVLHTVRNPPTIADGARTPHLGRHTLALIMRHVDRMLTVEEDEILDAMALAATRLGIVAEPAGALALAGAVRLWREEPGSIASLRVGVVVSGGNADPGVLSRALGRCRRVLAQPASALGCALS